MILTATVVNGLTRVRKPRRSSLVSGASAITLFSPNLSRGLTVIVKSTDMNNQIYKIYTINITHMQENIVPNALLKSDVITG